MSDLENKNPETEGVSTPGADTPGAEMSGTDMPGTDMPDVSMPGIDMPSVNTPDTGISETDTPQEAQTQEPAPMEEPMAEPPAPAPEEGGSLPPEAQEPVYPEEIFSHSADEARAAEEPQGGEAPTDMPGQAQPPMPPTPYPYQPMPPVYGTAPQQPAGWPNPPTGFPGQPAGFPGQPAGLSGQPAGLSGQPAGGYYPPTGYYPPAGGQANFAANFAANYGAYPGAYGTYPAQPGAVPSPMPGAVPPTPQPQPLDQTQPIPQPQPYPPYYGAPAPEAPPKKKKPLALKVFLWLASILAAGALLGFGIYVGVDSMVRDGKPDMNGYEDKYPEPSMPGEVHPDGSKPESAPESKPEGPEPVKPQVDVTPNTEGIQLHAKPDSAVMEPEEVYDQLVKSTVAISATLERDGKTAESHGTGIIATSDGYMITNSHVVLNSKSAVVTVATYDGQEYEAVVVGVDRTTDLAVIKTNDHGFIPAEFGDAEELVMGEWVLALGNPGGTRFSNSLTRGIVSGLNREVGQYSANGMTYIQTDAAINPGNSGGPLVNLYGQVVGINSSKIVTDNYEGMGFAIPVSKAQPIINELLSGGYIKGRTRLGIMCMEMEPAGLMITEFNEDSAFNGTEAQVGDIITALDGETVTNLSDVSNLLLKYAPGDKVEVTLRRPADSLDALPFLPDGESFNAYTELKVTITLLEDKGETQN